MGRTGVQKVAEDALTMKSVGSSVIGWKMSPSERIGAAASRLAPASSAVDILSASLAKDLNNPHTEKYRKVNVANPTFKRVADQPGAMELMHATGWENHYGHLLLQTFDRSLLDTAVACLRRIQRSDPDY